MAHAGPACKLGGTTSFGLNSRLQLRPDKTRCFLMAVPLADGLNREAHPQTLLQELARDAVTERLMQALVVVQLSATKPM
jgi:hypothetical protein